MFFDLTKSDDEDEPELLFVDSSIEEILVEKKKPSSSTRKSAEKRPREQRHPSPVKKKKEQKDEEIIYLDMDDDEEGKEKEGEEEVIFASVSPIPISKIKKRKVATTIVALAPPGEKRRALIEASGKGGALSNPPAPPLSTEWRWSCPECYREFSGNGIDTRHIEITRPGVLADCARKAQSSPSSQLSSPASYSPFSSSSSSSSSSMSDAHHLCSLDATNWEVVLLLDSREVRTRTDRTYIYNMLVAKERVNCEVRALPLGDVTWVVRRKKDSPRPAKIPPQLVRGGGGGGKSFFGMAIASCGSVGGVLPSSSSSSTTKTTSTSSKPTAAKKSTKDSEKKELKEKEKKAKLLAASSAPRAEEEYLLDYIIERKSCNDLAASIIDGRYNEQKMRLSNSGMRVTYLIEGDPHQVSLGGNGGQRALSGSGIPPVKIGAKHILTAMTNTQVFAGFHVVQTTSIDASISHIAAMHRIIEANFLASLACERETSITDAVNESGGRGGGGGESPMRMRGRTIGSPSSAKVKTSGTSIAFEGTRPLSSSIHRRAECPSDICSLTGRSTVLQRVTTYSTWALAMKRPRHMTVMTLFGRALRQVSGCSAERAQAILERYPTPASLLTAYKALPYPVRDGPGLLKGLPVRGQKACIGPALSSAVYEAFQGSDQRVKRVSTKDDEEDEDEEGGGEGGGEEGDELKEDEEV
jgi:ERCC4-type nuclease